VRRWLGTPRREQGRRWDEMSTKAAFDVVHGHFNDRIQVTLVEELLFLIAAQNQRTIELLESIETATTRIATVKEAQPNGDH
jgi:hypothetical protein